MESEKIEVRGGWGNALLAMFKKEDVEQKKDEETRKNMLFALGVFDLYVYDKKDNLLLEVKTLLDGKLKANECRGDLTVSDMKFNSELLKMWLKSMVQRNGKVEYNYVFNFNRTDYQDCKIILNGKLYKNDNEELDYIINIPNATLYNEFKLDVASDSVSSTPIRFEFYPYNEKGDMFEMKILGKAK
jgi:hypothetical protein